MNGDPSFKLLEVSEATLRGGHAVRVSYETTNDPLAPTGTDRGSRRIIERYDLYENDTSVVLTLSSTTSPQPTDPLSVVRDSLAI
jgi:hypothetical protein